jgi:hypothetical protein
MQKPHPFAVAPADKGRVRAVAKLYVTVYGYAQVSTDGQSVDAQIRQLRAAGAARCSAKWRAEPRPTGRSFADFSPKLPSATW